MFRCLVTSLLLCSVPKQCRSAGRANSLSVRQLALLCPLLLAAAAIADEVQPKVALALLCGVLMFVTLSTEADDRVSIEDAAVCCSASVTLLLLHRSASVPQALLVILAISHSLTRCTTQRQRLACIATAPFIVVVGPRDATLLLVPVLVALLPRFVPPATRRQAPYLLALSAYVLAAVVRTVSTATAVPPLLVVATSSAAVACAVALPVGKRRGANLHVAAGLPTHEPSESVSFSPLAPCALCVSSMPLVACVPCGHVLCVECDAALANSDMEPGRAFACPSCRGAVRQTVPLTRAR